MPIVDYEKIKLVQLKKNVQNAIVDSVNASENYL